MTAVIDEYESRDQKSLALIEELQMKYEIVKKESRAVSEQIQNVEVLSTPSTAVWGASDVDSVVAHLSSQLEKVTRERDSAMQSLQTVYGDRIELQQRIKMLESEQASLATRTNHLDAERLSLGEQLTQARGALSRLKYSAISRSTASLSSVGTGSIPNMPSVTVEADSEQPDLIDSLRAEFEELQRLRREKDRSSSSSAIMATGPTMSVMSHSEVNVNVKVTSAAGSNGTRDVSAARQKLSAGEVAEEMLSAEEMASLKQEYSALCAELVRLREMLITLQRVDHEREEVRSQFELEIRLLRDELLRRDQADTAAVTETTETALDDELKERDAEISSLKGRLSMTLSRIEELIAEKDEQCASYEQELEEVHEEHSNALKRIDALVQEHNILIGGQVQVPLSAVARENVYEMPVVIHPEILENVDEDISPKRMAYENQAKEIEHLRDQLQRAHQDIESLSLDRDRLNDALESSTAELLVSLEKAACENSEQQQMYEKKLASYTEDIEHLNRKLDTVSAELERSKSAHLSEMEKLHEEYQVQFNELSFSNDESKREQHQELCAVQKQCAEIQSQLEQIAAEKVSMEQEYITALQDVTKENSARITALREGFEQDLAQAQTESEKAYSDHAAQLEEELNQSRQEVAQLKQSLDLFEGGTHHADKHETEDLEALQVLQLRINDLTQTKDELQQQLDVVSSEKQQLISEVETLQSEMGSLRSQVVTLPQDYLHGFANVDAESVADTSGDSHVFYTPSTSRKTIVEKLKSLQAEKELLSTIIDRLNAEKEQLKSHLIMRHQPTHVFEADIPHLVLSSPEVVEACGVENSAEVRMMALESEKEVLAGMLEKLSCENEQLAALMIAASDNILDTSYDDINNIERSTILDTSEEPELATDEVVALRHECIMLRAKLSDLERQDSSETVQPTDRDKNEEEIVDASRDMEVVDSSIQTDISQVDENMLMAPGQSTATYDTEHLQRTVQHLTHERDVAHAEMLTFKKGIGAIMGDSIDVNDCQREVSADSMLAALNVFVHGAVEHENNTSCETVSGLQSQIAELHCKNVSALTEVHKILSDIDPSFVPELADENQCVDVTDALLTGLRLLTEKRVSTDASSDTAVSKTAASQQALLLESVTEERDKLYKELENARRLLLQVLPYRETVSVDNEQTIGSLIDQINHLVQQKNELEELAAKKPQSSSDDHEAVGSHFRVDAGAPRHDLDAQLTEVGLPRQRLTAAPPTLVDSSVQVNLQTVDRPEGLQVDSVELQQGLERPATETRVEDDIVDTLALDGTQHDQSSKDLPLRTEEESRRALAENVRMLQESLGIVTAERDRLRADLAGVVQEFVELKAGQADLTPTTKHSMEVLRNELDSVRSDREALAEREAAANRQLAKAAVERDELSGKVAALQDALKLALEERDRYLQGGSEAEAQIDLVKDNMWLQSRVKELEAAQVNLLDEKETVAGLYSKTVDELKARLVEMQATVESFQSEVAVKSQENEAVVDDLRSRLQAAETKCSHVDEENRQKLLDLADVQSVCEEKQKIIDELTSRLQSVAVGKSDDGDEDDDDNNSAEISHLDEDVSALLMKLQMFKAELEAVTEQRDEFAAKLSELEHSSDEFVKGANLAVVNTGFGADAVTENTDFAMQTKGPLISEETTNGQMKNSEATDHKEHYLHLHSRHCIAVSDERVDVKNITDEPAVESVDAAAETDVLTERNVDNSLQLRVDELRNETRGLKEERDEIRQKLLLAETCIQETQDSAKDKIKALEDELASLHEGLRHFETSYKALESEQQESAETWQAKTQKLMEELDTFRVERNSLSVELESAKCDLDACKRSCEEKMSSAESCIEALQSELATTLQAQQALTDELTTCRVHLEETASNEAKLSVLTGKCSELEAELSTVEQERDALKEESITSCTELAQLTHVHEQTTASMTSKIEDLEVQLAALKDENVTLTTSCSTAADDFSDFKNSQAEIESQLRNQIDDLEAQMKSLNAELEDAGLNLSAAERKCEELQQSLAATADDAAGKLESLSSELKNAVEEKAELLKKHADVDGTCAELRSQLESTLEDRNSLMRQLREAKNERMELTKSVVGHQEALVNIECLEKECHRLNEDNKCLSERCDAAELAKNTVESQLDDQQQTTSALQTENSDLIQTKEMLLSENGGLKQQISEYVDKLETFTSNQQLALENWTRTEEQLLTNIRGLEADLFTVKAENDTLKSAVDRIPLLTDEVASTAVERDDARKRCSEVEAEAVKLRVRVEDLNKFEATTTELTETKVALTQRCEEAEREVDVLKKLANEKSICVVELKSSLARTEEELAESQKEKESLLNALASERSAVKEQAAAHETAMSDVISRLSIAESASSKLEQLEKEFASKCEELKVAEDQLQRQSVPQHVGSVDAEAAADVEALQQECNSLRTLVSTCQLDANAAREKLSQMEGLCQVLTAERDDLVKERSVLCAEKDELSHELVLLQQQLGHIATDTVAYGTSDAEQNVLVQQLDVTPSDDVQLVNTDSVLQKEPNVVDGNATSLHENQITERNLKLIAVESELKTARETVHQLQEEVNSLRKENQHLQQMKPAAEDNLKTVTLELAASQPDTTRSLQQELAGEQSTQSTEGCEDLQTRLHELDALTEVETAITASMDSITSESFVHASRTFTKLVSSDVTAADISTCLTDNEHIPTMTNVTFPRGSLSDSNDDSPLVCESRTFTKLVSTDTASGQTVAETVADKTEVDVNDLYSQIDRLQRELEQQKLSQVQLTENLQAVETEYQEKLRALKDECDRQVSAAENCAHAKVLECSPSETSVVESASSTDGDSTAQLSDVISQRDQLRSCLAEKMKEMAELYNEIEQLREENEKRKTSLLAAAAVSESVRYYGDNGMDLNEESQRTVANLDSQLLMSTEENERLHQKINELEQRADRLLAERVNADRKQLEEQHVTEMKVLKFRLQEDYDQRVSHLRSEVEASLEETFEKRKEALYAEFRKKAENFRKETEQKFFEELRKVREFRTF